MIRPLAILSLLTLTAGCHPTYQFSTLRQVQPDMSRAETARVLRGDGRHQFTTSRGADEITCASYIFEHQYKVYFVFRNDRLAKTIRAPWFTTDPPDPPARVQLVLASAEHISVDAMEAKHREYQLGERADPAMGPASLSDAPPILISAPIQQDDRADRALARRYDGFRVDLEMTEEQVAAELGAPRRRWITGGETIAVYGEDDPRVRDVLAEHRFSWVMVVFRDGAATDVYSDDFFDPLYRLPDAVDAEDRTLSFSSELPF
ncbi:MAG: hypothetical protein GY715_13100 [Planctomycetes bacterium]|nr:hypothetical protein [Planctomycetota bacterium]